MTGRAHLTDDEARQLGLVDEPPAPSSRRRGGSDAFRSRADGYNRRRRAYLCLRCLALLEQVARAGVAGEPKRAVVRPRRPLACHCGQQTVDALGFDSWAEGEWFVGLARLQRAGELVDLVHHPRYPIRVARADGTVVEALTYIADAAYTLVPQGTPVVADFKPKAAAGLDPVFDVKRRLFEAQYAPLTITIAK